MKGSLRGRSVFLGLVLLAAGGLLVFASGRRPTEVSVTIAPGVELARAGDSWLLLLQDSRGSGSDGYAGTVEAEQVTQYGTLEDGRAVIDGRVDGAASWLVVGPAGYEAPESSAVVLATFPSRETLEEYLSSQSSRPPLLARPQEPVRDPGRLWGGVVLLAAGAVTLSIAVLLSLTSRASPRARPSATPATPPRARRR